MKSFRWKVFGIWVAVIAVVSLVFAWGSIAYTSRPQFCAECHLMEPYYASWESGTHGDVECMACHAEPGVLGTMEAKLGGLKQLLSYSLGTYRGKLPQGHVKDENCTACHSKASLEDKTLVFEGIAFEHSKHLGGFADGLDLACTTCHTQVDETAHIAVPLDTCYVCHLRNPDETLTSLILPEAAGAKPAADRDAPPSPIHPKGCRACHEDALRTNPEVAEKHVIALEQDIACSRCHGGMAAGADNPVTSDSCRRCHFESEILERAGEIENIHHLHLEDVKVECIDCHSATDHRSIEAHRDMAAKDCAACHEGMHEAQRRMFLGALHETEYMTALPEFHSGLQCQSCHIDLKSVDQNPLLGSARMTTADSCRTCHKDAEQGDFGTLLAKWKRIGAETLVHSQEFIRNVEVEVEGAKAGADRDRARVMLRWARQRLALVETGTPMHNIHLARYAFKRSGEETAEAAKLVGVFDRVPEFRNPTANMPDECARCHLATNEALPWGNRVFSHQKHVSQEGVTCTKCHSDEPKHGTVALSEQGCSDCHHSEENLNLCSQCHQFQSAMYAGDWEWAPPGKANLMAHDVACTECHFHEDDPERVIVRPTRDDCLRCHDQDIGVLLDDWKRTVKQGADTLAARIDAVEAVKTSISVEQRKLLATAKKVLDAVRHDGSGGIHNPGMAEAALAAQTRILDGILGR